MAINYADKYAATIDERFKLEAVSAPAVNNDYDFVGVSTVKVYSIPTAAMNDYTRSGSGRYGTPAELENSVQELTLTRDRSFTFTIDRANFDDAMMANSAGKALQRQLDEVVIPELDVYRLSKIAAGSGLAPASGALSASNAYEAFLDGTMALTENKVPVGGRVAYVSPGFHKLIKLDAAFIKNGDLSQQMLLKGQVGEVDGVPLILVPSTYLPAGTDFIITTPAATVGPVKLSEYKIHDNPPGINGWLVEGRVRYDAFVLDNKKNAIYVHKNTAGA